MRGVVLSSWRRSLFVWCAQKTDAMRVEIYRNGDWTLALKSFKTLKCKEPLEKRPGIQKVRRLNDEKEVDCFGHGSYDAPSSLAAAPVKPMTASIRSALCSWCSTLHWTQPLRVLWIL